MSERADRRPLGEDASEPEQDGRRKRKKRKPDEGADEEAAAIEREQAETNRDPAPETPDEAVAAELTEADLRKIAAEAAFRRRVELAELKDAIGDEAYAELQEEHGRDLRWYLEAGSVLPKSIVAETELDEDTPTPVKKVAVKYAIAREAEPVPPAGLIERVKAAFAPPARAESAAGAGSEQSRDITSEAVAEQAAVLARELPGEEAVTLVVETADRGPVLVDIDRQAIRVHETAAEDSPVAEERVLEPVRIETPPVQESLEAAGRIAAEAESEPLPLEPESPFAKTLETIEYAWAREHLPPISGGSPELDAESAPVAEDLPVPPDPVRPEELLPEIPEKREEKPPSEEDVLDGPEPSTPPREHSGPRRSRPRAPRVRMPDYQMPTPENLPPLPDAETRRRARRMLRKLAARFGLRLTPDLEGYLMQIVFRLRYVDGRLRRGVGVNIDILTRIMEALRSHYPLYTPKRPS